MSEAIAQIKVARTFSGPAWRRLALVVSLGLVLAAGGAAFLLSQGVDRQMQDVLRSYDLRKAARELTIALVDAESGQRGFVLTNDGQYLKPYTETLATIDDRLAALRNLSSDNTEQTTRVNVISGAVKAKLSEMASTVELVKSGQQAEAIDLVREGRGIRLMDELRQIISRFIADEDETLLRRNEGLTQLRTAFVAAILIALAAAVSLAYVLLSQTQRQVLRLALNQNDLFDERDALSQRVAERTAELEESRAHAQRERERVETLLKDTNHRIGNSLATVSSLLGLQMMRSSSEEIKEALEAARQRVYAIASAHRRLRLGDDLETTDIAEFLPAIVEDLQATYEQRSVIELIPVFDPIVINSRDATTLGILVGELVTNAFKHAFPHGRGGTIWVRLVRNAEGSAILEVADNGVGIEGLEPTRDNGLGSVIVRQLAQQFGGKPIYRAAPEGGLLVTVEVPKIEICNAAGAATL